MRSNQGEKNFFRAKSKWIEVEVPEKEVDSGLTELNDRIKNIFEEKKREGKQTYRQCIEYWDKIKDKYNYHHLYRKRILKIKQEDLQGSIEKKSQITRLLHEHGVIQALYCDKSKDIGVRGEGVWEFLNGAKVKSKEEPVQTTSSTDTRSSETVDVIDEIKKCLLEESGNASDNNIPESDLTTKRSSESKINETSSKRNETLCTHIIHPKHKKLFTVPECLETESSSKETSLEFPTAFELCMRELHDLEKPIQIESEKIKEAPAEVEDPWRKLKRCQTEKYGFSDLSSSTKIDPVEKFSDEELYEKVISNIMKKDLRVKGHKMKIDHILGNEKVKEVVKYFKQAEVTVTGKDGKFVQGLDLRKVQEEDEEDSNTFNIILQNLVGEWTAMGIFLKELAKSTEPTNKKPNEPLPTNTHLGTPHGTLGKKVKKMVSDIAEDEAKQAQTRDIKVDIDFGCNDRIAYRQKTDYKIQMDKNNSKVLSKQTATKKELSLGTNEEKSRMNAVGKKIPTERVKICRGEQQAQPSDNQEQDFKISQRKETFHRGLVELISGSKYAGSWGKLGMEGCGTYISPGGTGINGNLTDGVFNGPATIYLPNGIVIAGAFDKGQFHSPKIQFGDGLEYRKNDWQYLKETEKLSKSQIRMVKPILDREIPEGCYDTGEGFYNPETKQIYHPVTMAPIRAVSLREEKWILSVCRSANPNCVSLDEHLYESFDIPKIIEKKKKQAPVKEDFWKDCQSPLYNVPFDLDPRDKRSSPDKLIYIDEKSKPVEEIWDSIRSLTGSQRPKIGVPFSYEKAVQYTCFDGLNNPTQK